MNAHMSFVSRRSSKLAAIASVCALGLAGCGGDDEPSTGGGGGSPDVDAAALLRDSTLNFKKDGKPIEQGTFAFSVSGKVNAPKDEDLQALDGKVNLVTSFDKKPAGAKETDLPPFSIGVNVDGSYTDGKGAKQTGKYDAGFSYIGDAFFAKWDGTDYAVGEEFSKQLLAEIDKEAAKAGGGTTPAVPDTQKLVDAMDLQPETWLTDPKAENGPTLDGVETYKITGDVAIQPMLDDIVDGLRKVPDVVPFGDDADELRGLKDISDEDYKTIDETLETAEVEVYVGKEDKLQRRFVAHIVGKDEKEPVDFDLTITLDSSKLGVAQDLKAPAQSEPITDLFLKLEKEFGGSGAGGGLFGALGA